MSQYLRPFDSNIRKNYLKHRLLVGQLKKEKLSNHWASMLFINKVGVGLAQKLFCNILTQNKSMCVTNYRVVCASLGPILSTFYLKILFFK